MKDMYQHFSLELMKLGISFLQNAKLNSKIHQNIDDPFRFLLVYCLYEVKNGIYLPLNRDYKPLGIISNGWADYKDKKYCHLHIDKKDMNFDLLWDNNPGYFTFSDSTYPQGKNLQRYIQIIKNTFFGVKTNFDFDYVWGYKKNTIVYEKEYMHNISRFKCNYDLSNTKIPNKSSFP